MPENSAASSVVTAAILVIGDEILSGRTKDRNIGYIADFLTAMGINLKEARVVSDDQPEIVAALNALRTRYTYVFTTGGIGPTHDDITADAVAAAFGVGISEDERAMNIMLERYKLEDLTPARRRMTRIPHGAELVDNPVSKAPGFRIGNVIVMAGVPQIMQAMLDSAAKGLQGGAKMLSHTIEAAVPEGRYGDPLAKIAKEHAEVIIGSYPSFADGKFRNQIVVRGRDLTKIDASVAAVRAMLAGLPSDAKPL